MPPFLLIVTLEISIPTTKLVESMLHVYKKEQIFTLCIDFEICIIIAAFQTSTLIIINLFSLFSYLLGQSVGLCVFQLKAVL